MRWGRRKKQFVSVVLALTIFIIVYIFRHRYQTEHVDIFFPTNFVGEPQGFLNVAIWTDICGDDVKSLKEFPLFPHGPKKRMLTSSLRLHFARGLQDFGLRIFGFLSPTENGNYSFYLTSSETSELWISSNLKPENGKLIAGTTAGLSWKHLDHTILLHAGKRYYLELLVKHADYRGIIHHIHVTWKSSSWKEQKPREMPSNVFLPFENDSSGTPDRVLPIHSKYQDLSFANEEVQRRAEMYRLPFISESDSENLFPLCPYNPSYLVKKPLRRYQAVWEMHYSSIYPFDYSDLLERKPVRDFVHFGNDELDENTARAVTAQVWTQILKKHPGKYSLKRILNVEQNHDEGKGDRYLVELELEEITSGKSVRFSQYVYKQRGVETLCTPKGVAWNKSAMINILLTTGNNQGRWILHFLENMRKIYNKTKDSNFNVIITDFDSKDLDIEKALKQAAIPNYLYANIKDKFSRALGLQWAAEMVKEPNSIVFAMDLHLDIPYHFLDDVRKHCIQNKMAYSPFVIRLSCGALPSHPLGYWEVQGLGLMGMYKSDWDKVGGMNTEEYKNTWGGEDWEMADRILQTGMEVEILKMMHFFHYYHSKDGLWTDTKDPLQEVSSKYWQYYY